MTMLTTDGWLAVLWLNRTSYVISRGPCCVFTLFKKTVKYTNFALRYNKTISNWRHRLLLDFFSQFVKHCFRSLTSGNILRTLLREKISNNDLDASHYLYIITQYYVCYSTHCVQHQITTTGTLLGYVIIINNSNKFKIAVDAILNFIYCS